MKTEMTDDIFLVINDEADQPITYAKTATEAVQKAGCPPWNWLFQSKAASKLEPGDELSVRPSGSVIRLTGKDIDFNG